MCLSACVTVLLRSHVGHNIQRSWVSLYRIVIADLDRLFCDRLGQPWPVRHRMPRWPWILWYCVNFTWSLRDFQLPSSTEIFSLELHFFPISFKIRISRKKSWNSDLERSCGQIFGGADAVDQARLCFLLFSLLGDRGTVSGTCSGTASSDGDWRCKN